MSRDVNGNENETKILNSILLDTFIGVSFVFISTSYVLQIKGV